MMQLLMFLPLIDEQNDWQLHSSKSKIHHSYLMCRSKDFIQVAMSYNSAFKRLFSDLWTVYAWYLVLYKVYIYIYIFMPGTKETINEVYYVLHGQLFTLTIHETRNVNRSNNEIHSSERVNWIMAQGTSKWIFTSAS